MKRIGIISTTALFLLFGNGLPVYGQQEKQEEKEKPAKQEEQAKPEKQEQAKAPKQEKQVKPEKQEQAKAPKQEKQAKPERQQQAKAPKQEQQPKPEKQEQAKGQQDQQRQQQKQQDKSAKQEQRQAKGQQKQHQQPASSSQPPQRTQQAQERQRALPELRLSARGGGRIPDDRFRSNFGREHRFNIGEPVFVDGYSRFQYGGFWFGFVDPWPADWYYTDDVYIDYVDGGYYMYNPYYPGARFAITVVV